MKFVTSTRKYLIVILFSFAALAGCSSVEPAIVGQTANEGFVDGDYAIQVDCTYKNNGAQGSIQVWSKLSSGGVWVESQNIALAKNETQLVRFTFTGPTIFGNLFGSGNYACGYGAPPAARPATTANTQADRPPAKATSEPKPLATTTSLAQVIDLQSEILGTWRLSDTNNIFLAENQIMNFSFDGSISVEASGLFGPIKEVGEYAFRPDGRIHITVYNEFGFAYNDSDYEVSIKDDEMRLTTLGFERQDWVREQ